ncbi:MAG: transglutaminase family protein [Pseudomonadota bacterium]
MNRRAFIMMAAAAPLADQAKAAGAVSAGDYLSRTRYLEVGHPRIEAIVSSVAPRSLSNVERAVALFTYVRDRIPFGFASGFWNQTATEVLDAGIGYCNTKSTLLTTLLRTAGIPARQVFVDIDAEVLDGLIQPGTPYLDHSYVEVFLEGAWRRTDAYVVDQALFEAAHQRVQAESRRFGYGVHVQGTMVWNGTDQTFSQYNLNADHPLGTRTWGVYEDIGAFYAGAEAPWNRLNALVRAGFGLLASDANAKADTLRKA